MDLEEYSNMSSDGLTISQLFYYNILQVSVGLVKESHYSEFLQQCFVECNLKK